MDNSCCSKLYSLKPIGIGTPFAESILFYFIRLAREHCVSPMVLFEEQVRPLIFEGETKLGYRGFDFRCLVGAGELSRRVVSAVESLTMRTDLSSLTIQTLEGAIAYNGSSRLKRVWCPDCLNEHREGQAVTEQLAWSISAVNACTKHSRYLVARCPVCCNELPVFRSGMRPGYCTRCSAWLGKEGSSTGDDLAPDVQSLEIELHIARYMGEIIAEGIPRTVSPRDCFRKNVKVIVAGLSGNNIADAASELGIPKSVLWGWHEGHNIPRLRQLLAFCYTISIPLLQLLTENLDPECVCNIEIRKTFRREKKIRAKPIDYEKLEGSIIELMNNSEVPLSADEVATRLGINKRMLYRNLHERNKQINDTYQNYKEQQKSQAFQEELNRVGLLTQQLHTMGITPTRRILEKSFPSTFAYRKRKAALKVWRAKRKELGIDT